MNNKKAKNLQLGKKIGQFRAEKGYTQEVLSGLLGISRQHLANVETAQRTVSLGLLMDIAHKLDKPVRDFFEF